VEPRQGRADLVPDEASFRDWQQSDAYQEIAKERKSGADAVVLLISGMA